MFDEEGFRLWNVGMSVVYRVNLSYRVWFCWDI